MTPTPTDPHEPVWGEAPVPDVLAALLAERYPLEEEERFEAEVRERGLACTLRAPHHAIRIQIDYAAGARSRDPWVLLVDALDALVGQLIESGRAHRELPTGTGVEYEGAQFRVLVEKEVPELGALADRWLRGSER